MFRNTLTPNDKYHFPDCENFSAPIKTQLSSKTKTFSHFFVPFLELNQIFKFLRNNMIVIATLFRKLQTVKDLVRPLFKKHRFRNSFDNQYVRESQTLVKSASVHIRKNLLFKKHCFRNSFDNQYVKESKGLCNLHESTFIIFFHHYGRP